jgi:hypothetical protein
MVINWSKGERSNSSKSIARYLGSRNGSAKMNSAGSAKMKPASSTNVFKPYGKHVFTGKLAEHYVTKHGGSATTMADSSWVKDRKQADIVAAALLDW